MRAAAPSGTGAPANQPATWRAPAGVSRSTRTGDPPTSTEPRATSRVPGIGGQAQAGRRGLATCDGGVRLAVRGRGPARPASTEG